VANCQQLLAGLQSALEHYAPRPRLEEVGRVHSLGNGVARVQGLPSAASEELLLFEGDRYGLVFNLDPEELGVVLLDDSQQLAAGSLVRRSGRTLDVPVGPGLLGRVVDPLGRPLDGLGPIQASGRIEVDRPAPPIAARAPVRVPLQTGVKVVDALFPIGRGQRMLIMGDRQTGKSTLALDTLLNQRGNGVICVYCFIGQRGAAVAQAVAELRSRGAMDYTIVVVARGEDPPGLHYLAPYAATSLAEYFVGQGQEALVIYDDLTRHARSYRELSLLLRRPPGREAFPGDIFYAHSRLLERSTRLLPEWGGGSLTALPIVETEAQNLAAYLPTNLVSITDGQLILTPELFQKGMMPAVDTGTSVSRVGGDAQLPAYRGLAGELRLSYAQFQELESFSKLASRLDDETRQSLERGRRWREVLKQPEHEGLSAPEQIAILLAVSQGLMDQLALPLVSQQQRQWIDRLRQQSPPCLRKLSQGLPLDESLRAEILQVLS
jgi:F-type H+-transporting ATPase subunit alpha